jgi:histidinol dehydrogenase
LGDYFAGPNHTLPTSGTAKFSSPLGVYDFLKKSSILSYDAASLKAVSDKIAAFARSEGLDAHAKAVERRFEN